VVLDFPVLAGVAVFFDFVGSAALASLFDFPGVAVLPDLVALLDLPGAPEGLVLWFGLDDPVGVEVLVVGPFLAGSAPSVRLGRAIAGQGRP
jgi:hypothetical protein